MRRPWWVDPALAAGLLLLLVGMVIVADDTNWVTFKTWMANR
jgi:hypothetical protein